MSVLFEPMDVGNLTIKNRFVHSATCESVATERGEVTDDLLKRYRTLARGEIGLIVPGYLYIDPVGKGMPRQTGIYLVGGLRRVSHMEQVLEAGYADFISMSRPFIREPNLVKQIREGKTEVAACQACNRCVAAEVVGIPVRCYASGFPQ